MLSMPWFLLVPIAKACRTRKRYAGSTRPVAGSLTLFSFSPSSPSRNQKCPLSSPPPARRFHPPCKHTSPVHVLRICVAQLCTPDPILYLRSGGSFCY